MNILGIAQEIAADKPTLFERKFVYAGSFDPWANHHDGILNRLIELKAKLLLQDPTVPIDIVVWPVGPYTDKQQVAPPEARKEILLAAVAGLDVSINTHDLDFPLAGYTSTYQMQADLSLRPKTALREKYLVTFGVPSVITEVWHVIGADNVAGIKEWDFGSDLWKHGRFLILTRPGHLPKVPKHSIVLNPRISGSSKHIRELIENGEPWEQFVSPATAAIIKNRNLYGYGRKES